MSRITFRLLVLAVVLFSISAFAADGQILINQAAVNAAGGFPYKITQPGSYKLSGNLVASADGLDAIDISANNVSVDLNGFTISSTAQNPGTGIVSQNSGIRVSNGSIQGFSGGLVLGGSLEIIDHVTISNAVRGIFMFSGVVSHSIIQNTSFALSVGLGSYMNNFIAKNKFGLAPFDGQAVYGLNTIVGNDFDLAGTPGLSMNNNICSSGPC
jgi:hypothetical protein